MTYRAGDTPSETSDPLGRWADQMQYPLRDFFDRLNAHLPRAVAEALAARLGVYYLEQLLTELDRDAADAARVARVSRTGD